MNSFLFSSSLALAMQSSMIEEVKPIEMPPPVDFQLSYVFDVIGVAAGDGNDQLAVLDNLDVEATADLDRLVGWQGGSAHLHILNNLGGNPNNRAGTLQGVDNIEVGTQRLRLFEAWVEQKIGRTTSLRAGLYDLNSEFYTNDAAVLLIAPAFGVGSEMASTGPNGPSIFPSTALSVRIDQRILSYGYARIAVLNANAGTLGDAQGVNLSFDQGALLVSEVGVEHDARKLSLGAWRYTRLQNDIRDLDAAGEPVGRVAQGVYAVVQWPVLASSAGQSATIFGRVGLSDGQTTPFHGGWQAGIMARHVFKARPDSIFSVGFNQGYLSYGYRQNLADSGTETAQAESAIEITYSDRVNRYMSVQPDFQLVLNPGGELRRKPLIVAGVRITVDM